MHSKQLVDEENTDRRSWQGANDVFSRKYLLVFHTTKELISGHSDWLSMDVFREVSIPNAGRLDTGKIYPRFGCSDTIQKMI